MNLSFTTLTPADLPALRTFFAASNDMPYDLARVAREKCFGRGAGGAPVCTGAMKGGELAGVSVVSGRFLRILCVGRGHRRTGIGSALLADAEKKARASHATRLLISGEPANYFVPGLLQGDTAIDEALQRRGYHPENCATNLVASLDDLPEPPAIAAAIVRARPAMRRDVERFITSTFSALWTMEVSPAWQEEEPPLFVAMENGRVIGFSAHEVNNRGLGFYGPAGVDETKRRGGIGRALLLASLRDLVQRGFRVVVIPWVSSIEFYANVAGARVAEQFVTYSKKLSRAK